MQPYKLKLLDGPSHFGEPVVALLSLFFHKRCYVLLSTEFHGISGGVGEECSHKDTEIPGSIFLGSSSFIESELVLVDQKKLIVLKLDLQCKIKSYYRLNALTSLIGFSIRLFVEM